MSRHIQWLSELKTVENTQTGVKRYYFMRCGVWSRIAKDVYKGREQIADRADSFLTRTSANHIHQFKTVYGTHHTK